MPSSRKDASGRVRNLASRRIAIVAGSRWGRTSRDRAQHRARRGVAAQAQQQQVARLVWVERGLGVPLEHHRRRCRELPAFVGAVGHDVLDEAATVLLHVADGLAERARHRQQRQLAPAVLAGARPRVRRGRGNRAHAEAPEQQRAVGAGIGAERRERGPDCFRQLARRVPRGRDEALVERGPHRNREPEGRRREGRKGAIRRRERHRPRVPAIGRIFDQ